MAGILRNLIAAAVSFVPGGLLSSTTVQAALIELDARSATPGDVKFIAGATAPAGWLKANGALISRTAYAALFAQLGTTYGAGDGSTTFALPDLRGEFLRGWDDGRGIDASRARGSWQAAMVESHSHGYGQPNATSSGGNTAGIGGGNNSAQTSAYGGSETRPRNYALMAVIKY